MLHREVRGSEERGVEVDVIDDADKGIKQCPSSVFEQPLAASIVYKFQGTKTRL